MLGIGLGIVAVAVTYYAALWVTVWLDRRW